MYFKESLPVRVLDVQYLSECLLCEICLLNKKCYVITIYRSPSQNTEEFEEFLQNFEKLLLDISKRKPFMTIILGDFNARSTAWWADDTTNTEGIHLESLTSTHGFHQLISEPTHILPNSSSCIDLIFTNQPNLAIDSGVHPSLHPNCHHQIVFSKFNLKIEYPPPYKRLVWDYNKAKTDSIIKSLKSINWINLFSNKSC